MSDRDAGRVVVAPDKFKASLSASDAALAIERGLRAVWPSREIVRAPMADGGEGTVAAFLDAGWTRIVRRVRGPLGCAVDAAFALAPGGETAAIEMTAASGLATLAGASNDVLRASSFGTGELVRSALDRGARRIVVGLGGSATNDGGAGLLEALGVRFFDADDRALAPGGGSLARIARFDAADLDPRVRDARIVAAVDVDAPLTGARGATRTYARQKGASAADVELLEDALERFARVTAERFGSDARDEPGCGAAGGLGFALRAYLGATIESGVDVVARERGLERLLAGAAWCCTGEGAVDVQTLAGKTVAGVGALARAAGARTVAFTARVDRGAEERLAELGTIVVPIADRPQDTLASKRRAAELLERAAARFARIVHAGGG